jgi:hypothetical protein
VVAWFVVPLLFRRERTPAPRPPGEPD